MQTLPFRVPPVYGLEPARGGFGELCIAQDDHTESFVLQSFPCSKCGICSGRDIVGRPTDDTISPSESCELAAALSDTACRHLPTDTSVYASDDAPRGMVPAREQRQQKHRDQSLM